MISAILLCAGRSQRMGRCKALLDWRGRPLVHHALSILAQTKLDEILVITGAETEAVHSAVSIAAIQTPIRIINNPAFATGMMSSIQAGVAGLNPHTKAFLISLVDLPFVEPSDCDELVSRFLGGAGDLIRCAHDGQPGHPVLISAQFADAILKQPQQDRGCSFLFKNHPHITVDLSSPRGHMDMDRQEQYHAYVTT